MAEHENKNEYASPLKRVWAWVGVAYMVIAVLLVTYMLAFASYLRGIGGLMICPALAGCAASLVHLWRTGARSPLRSTFFTLTLGLCTALTILGLWAGVPALIHNFGMR